MPRVEIEPVTAHAGSSISIAVDSGCDVETPEGGWKLIAAPVGHRESAVRVSVDENLADGFTAQLRLPEDFPEGEAFAGIDEWDFSKCSDSGSCASPTSGFTVTSRP